MASDTNRLEGGAEAGGQVLGCVHLETCGACTAMNLPYELQVAAKRERLRSAIGVYPQLEQLVPEDVQRAEPIEGYRTRAKLVVGLNGELGLYAKDTAHEVADIPGCRVLAPSIAQVAARLRQVFHDGWLPMTPGVVLLAVDLREVVDEGRSRVMVTLVLRKDLAPPRDRVETAAKELLAQIPEVSGVACSLKEPDSPRVLGQELVSLAGEDCARDHIGPVFHYATHGSFVQVHRGQARKVHLLIESSAREQFGKLDGVKVFELYGGSGAIGLSLAQAGASVNMIESFSLAVQGATRAAREQGLQDRFRATCGDALMAGRSLIGSGCDLIVVNPPRRGLAPGVRELVASAGAKAAVYVSCDPDTLARDLDHLRRLGLAPSRLMPIDMIPQTEEVETFAWLTPAPVPAPAILYEDDEVIAVEKAPHEPTTPQAEHGSSLLARARCLDSTGVGVPVRRLDVGASGVCLIARSAAHAARWADALNAPSARSIYVVGCRGITPAKGSITRELREQGRLLSARTRYRRLAVFAGHSILRVVPEQAHPHQIRRHLAAIGHPVLGDERYGHGPTNRFFEEKHGLDRTFQHCVRIELNHPTTGYRLVIESPVAPDLRTTLHRSGGPPTLLFLAHKHALGTRGYSSIPPAPFRPGEGPVSPEPGSAPSSADSHEDEDQG